MTPSFFSGSVARLGSMDDAQESYSMKMAKHCLRKAARGCPHRLEYTVAVEQDKLGRVWQQKTASSNTLEAHDYLCSIRNGITWQEPT